MRRGPSAVVQAEIDRRWRMILRPKNRGRQILDAQKRLNDDINWLQNELDRANQELTQFYSEIELYIKEDSSLLLEIAQLDKVRACVIARRTVVKTSLRDAYRRVTGLLRKGGGE